MTAKKKTGLSKKAEKPRKAGRPAVKIDWKKVDNFLKAGCTGTEIAAAIGVYPDTLYKHCQEDHKTDFTAYSQEKRAAGDAILRAQQYKAALEGNTTMQVWLGKQRLGQKDKQEVDMTTNGKDMPGQNIQIYLPSNGRETPESK